MKTLRLLKIYLRNRKAINAYYNYGLEHGYIYDETAGWQKRTELWVKADADIYD